MGRHVLKPVKPLVLEFQSETEGEENTVLTALFNNEAFLIYADEFGEINLESMEGIEDNPYEIGGKLLYCGLKNVHPKMTLEEATTILMMGGNALYEDVMLHIIDNFMMISNEETKKKFNLLMEEQMEEISKQISL